MDNEKYWEVYFISDSRPRESSNGDKQNEPTEVDLRVASGPCEYCGQYFYPGEHVVMYSMDETNELSLVFEGCWSCWTILHS